MSGTVSRPLALGQWSMHCSRELSRTLSLSGDLAFTSHKPKVFENLFDDVLIIYERYYTHPSMAFGTGTRVHLIDSYTL